MNIYVLNKSFEMIGIIDSYTSVIWNIRFFQIGEFEIYCRASKENLAILKRDYFLVREKDISSDILKNVMVIKNIELKADAEDGDMLIVTGKDLRCIMQQRVFSSQTYLSGTLPECIHMALIECALNPETTNRTIPDFEFLRNTDIKTQIQRQITGENVCDFICNICEEYEIGWKIDVKNSKFVVELYQGADRSYNQRLNSFVVFSSTFNNLLNCDYQNLGENFKNVAYVGGEGDGNEQEIIAVGDASGLDRFETWVDASETSSNEGIFSESIYENILIAKGKQALAETVNNELFEAEIDDSGQFKINRDYFLGDIVQFENEYGIRAIARVVEVIESEDESGVYVIPTFSALEQNLINIPRSGFAVELTALWRRYYGDNASEQITLLAYPSGAFNAAAYISVYYGSNPTDNNSFMCLAYTAEGEVIEPVNSQGQQTYTRFNFDGNPNAGVNDSDSTLRISFALLD